jgi:hypothetical protein
MRIKNVKYKDEESIMIYINQEENNNNEIQDKIKSYKAQYKNVAVFLSGNNRIEDMLEKVIKNN